MIPREIFRRSAVNAVLAIGVAVVLLSACGSPQDEVYPSSPLTLVVNWPAGGGMDRAGRLVAEYAGRRLDVPIAVINVAGSGGAIGIRHVAEARSDGYTVGILGALSIVFGIILLANTWIAAATLPVVLGIFGIVGGILAIIMAFRLR